MENGAEMKNEVSPQKRLIKIASALRVQPGKVPVWCQAQPPVPFSGPLVRPLKLGVKRLVRHIHIHTNAAVWPQITRPRGLNIGGLQGGSSAVQAIWGCGILLEQK